MTCRSSRLAATRRVIATSSWDAVSRTGPGRSRRTERISLHPLLDNAGAGRDPGRRRLAVQGLLVAGSAVPLSSSSHCSPASWSGAGGRASATSLGCTHRALARSPGAGRGSVANMSPCTSLDLVELGILACLVGEDVHGRLWARLSAASRKPRGA